MIRSARAATSLVTMLVTAGCAPAWEPRPVGPEVDLDRVLEARVTRRGEEEATLLRDPEVVGDSLRGEVGASGRVCTEAVAVHDELELDVCSSRRGLRETIAFSAMEKLEVLKAPLVDPARAPGLVGGVVVGLVLMVWFVRSTVDAQHGG